MQDKKQTLTDAVSFISTALEQIKELMNTEASAKVDPDKFNQALATAFAHGYDRCKRDIESAYVSIDLEEGPFSYSNNMYLSDIISVDDICSYAPDVADSWIGSSEHEDVINQFDEKSE